MKFQKKKVSEQVRGILSKHLDGTEMEFREATEKIVQIIKGEHIAKEHFRNQRDNALIAAYRNGNMKRLPCKTFQI